MDQQLIELRRDELSKRQAHLADQIRVFRRPLALEASKDEADRSIENETREEQQRELALSLMEFDRIRRILSRIEDGTYGFCRECQDEIPPVRLNCDGADTTICVVCAEKVAERFRGKGLKRSRH